MLSIIIPTLNEAKYLPLLLESIKKQNLTTTQKLLRNFDDLEIIVADGESEDNTIEVAKNYGCKIVSGGLLAKGRNEGAKIARGELLLFVDGDTILPENFLENILKEFKERNLGVGSFFLYPYQKSKFLKFFYNLFYNWWPALALEKILPHASNTILVKKEIHQKLGGFDEEIKIGEDHVYAREAAKIGKFGILRSSPTFVLMKRFDCDGWLNTGLKYGLAELYMIFFGPIKSDIFKYRFGHFDQEENKKLLKSSGGIFEGIKAPFKITCSIIKGGLGLGIWLLVSAILVLVSLIKIFLIFIKSGIFKYKFNHSLKEPKNRLK